MSNLIQVVGSIANDYISVYDGVFGTLVGEGQKTMAFLANTVHKQYGGTGANIAYGMKHHMRGAQVDQGLPYGVQLFGAVGNGSDVINLEQRLWPEIQLHIASSGDKHTAQCTIISDSEGNQIIAFHPGAMADSSKAMGETFVNVQEKNPGRVITIVSPTDKATMLSAVALSSGQSAITVFDPGQQVGQFTPVEMLDMLLLSDVLIVNSHEAKQVENLVGSKLEELMEDLPKHARLRMIIQTKGAEGVYLIHKMASSTAMISFPAVTVKGTDVVDPTGCGDAFRAGFFGQACLIGSHEESQRWLLEPSTENWHSKIKACMGEGQQMAAACVQSKGPQTYASILNNDW